MTCARAAASARRGRICKIYHGNVITKFDWIISREISNSASDTAVLVSKLAGGNRSKSRQGQGKRGRGEGGYSTGVDDDALTTQARLLHKIDAADDDGVTVKRTLRFTRALLSRARARRDCAAVFNH